MCCSIPKDVSFTHIVRGIFVDWDVWIISFDFIVLADVSEATADGKNLQSELNSLNSKGQFSFSGVSFYMFNSSQDSQLMVCNCP